MSNETPIEAIELAVAPDPRLARLVRMTAANVAALSSMSVDRIEDIRMAAEEAFIYACGAAADKVAFRFEVDPAHVAIDVELGALLLQAGHCTAHLLCALGGVGTEVAMAYHCHNRFLVEESHCR